jgi:hypothetical protein
VFTDVTCASVGALCALTTQMSCSRSHDRNQHAAPHAHMPQHIYSAHCIRPLSLCLYLLLLLLFHSLAWHVPHGCLCCCPCLCCCLCSHLPALLLLQTMLLLCLRPPTALQHSRQ